MVQLKCDRCGHVVPDYVATETVSLLYIQVMKPDRSTTDTEATVDLCTACIDDLKTFFKEDNEGLTIEL